MKDKRKKLIQYATLVLALFTTAFFIYYAFFLLPHLSDTGTDKNETAENRSYHVLVIGNSENESFLGQIYKGAQQVSGKYDAVVELNVPESQAQDVSLQALLDYASFTDTDGIIAFIDTPINEFKLPLNSKGTQIPLVTVVRYNPELPQVSFIGTNYSELGRKIAVESNSLLSGKGSLIIINTSSSNNPNYSTLMNSLINSLREYQGIHSKIADSVSQQGIVSVEDRIRSEITSAGISLIVCLTAEDTIRAAQAVSDLGKTGKTRIIGFGSGETVDMYLEKGVITELLSIDPEKTGEMAMQELFEYIQHGYANSYITADMRVRRAGTR